MNQTSTQQNFHTVMSKIKGSDYLNAIKVAAQGKLTHAPCALLKVAIAKFVFRFGPRYFSLFELWKRPVSAWGSYIQHNNSNPILRLINKQQGRDQIALVRDKVRFFRHCKTHSLPTIPILCIVQKGEASAGDSNLTVRTAQELCDALRGAPQSIFIKLRNGSYGDGAFVAHRRGLDWQFGGRVGSADELFDYCVDRTEFSNRAWLVQPVVVCHADLQPITGIGALGTVRAVTTFIDGQHSSFSPDNPISPFSGNQHERTGRKVGDVAGQDESQIVDPGLHLVR